mmetsp:Transcript_11924/g.51343  ORF Transcript_11924/g.51343 Transcript_11924/m.51343 type:complete len:379 (-) Transcript_11924:130-1266(-)
MKVVQGLDHGVAVDEALVLLVEKLERLSLFLRAPRGFCRELLAQNVLRVIRGHRLRRRDGRCLTLLELLQLSAEPVDEIPLRLLHRGVGEILLVFNHRVPEQLGGDETLATFVAQFPDPSHELGVRVGTEHVPGVGEEEGPAFGGGGGGERLAGTRKLGREPVPDLSLRVGVDADADILGHKAGDEAGEGHATGGGVRVRREERGEDVRGWDDEKVGEDGSKFRLVDGAIPVGVKRIKRPPQRRRAPFKLLRNLIDDELAHRGNVPAECGDVPRGLGLSVEAPRAFPEGVVVVVVAGVRRAVLHDGFEEGSVVHEAPAAGIQPRHHRRHGVVRGAHVEPAHHRGDRHRVDLSGLIRGEFKRSRGGSSVALARRQDLLA